MGCDIHSIAQRRVEGQWKTIEGTHPFDWRDYGMYGFLADVRNYSAVPPIAEQRGIPNDYVGNADLGDHSFSWLSVEELKNFDYDKPLEDLRVTLQISSNHWSGRQTAAPGGGRMTTYREFLGSNFFRDLETLVERGAERVVFGFDS